MLLYSYAFLAKSTNYADHKYCKYIWHKSFESKDMYTIDNANGENH